MARSIDLLVSSGKVVTRNGIFNADIAVNDGKIISVSSSERFDASRRINAEGKIVIPGVIDPHVHIYSEGSGRTFEENCELETPSMVSGGVTTSLGFVASLKSYSSIIPRMIETIPQASLVDMHFHLVINNDLQLRELQSYHEGYDIHSFKFFMGEKGVEIFPGTLTVDDGFLYDGLGEIASLGEGSVAMIHAENWAVINRLRRRLKEQNKNDQSAWTDSRPGIGEEEAIRRAAFLAKEQSCRLYIVHVSSFRSLSALRWAKEKGVDIESEVTPHNLILTRDNEGPFPLKFTPPVREQMDSQMLWAALSRGEISCVGSDAVPGKTKKDLPPKDNIWIGGGTGFMGSGLILPLLMSEGYHSGRLSLQRLVQVTSSNAAKIFSLYPGKGELVPGSDADIVIIDPDLEVSISPETLHLSGDFTPFDGRKVKGWPVSTILRGEIQSRDGEVTSESHGLYLGQKDSRN